MELTIRKQNYEKLLLVLLYTLPILIGIEPKLFVPVSYAFIFLLIALALTKNLLQLAFPVVLMYSYVLNISGKSITTIYLFLLLLNIAIVNKGKINKTCLTPIVITGTYILINILNIGLAHGFKLLFVNVMVIIYVFQYMKNTTQGVLILSWYVYAVLSATTYGFLTLNAVEGAIQVGGRWVSYNRFMGTFEDMNYWGFFVNVAIGIVFLSADFSIKKKIFILGPLYLSLLATTSITAYLANVILITMFCILRGMNWKVVVGISIFSVLLFDALTYALSVDIGILSDAATRIFLKFSTSNSASDLTTGRTDLWKVYLDYFSQQSIFKILFGFNVVLQSYNATQIKNVPHQEHITWLVDLGIIGAIVMEAYLIKNIMQKLSIRKLATGLEKTYIDQKLLVLTMWVFYSFGITMFTDIRFYFFYWL